MDLTSSSSSNAGIGVSGNTDSFFKQDSPDTPISNEVTLKRLHEAIIIQQDQICQASRALAFCQQNENFKGSREEVNLKLKTI